MATTTQSTSRPARRRGRVAVHDPETLLDLVPAGSRAAAAAGEAVTADAADENARARQAGSHSGDVSQARFDATEAEVNAIYQAGKVRQPAPVAFSNALRAVLAGPHAEVEAPRQ